VADIAFSEEGDWLNCELKADGQLILRLLGRKLSGKESPRFRVHPITFRNGYLLRSELVMGKREMGSSKREEDVTIELGNHRIAEDIKGLGLGKLLGYNYCPNAQGILTPVIESFSIKSA
jgi:hypothetical protein